MWTSDRLYIFCHWLVTLSGITKLFTILAKLSKLYGGEQVECRWKEKKGSGQVGI
jgi:hypothetical protein